MPKQNIIILGGGISGLTMAHDLAPYANRFNICLIEKESRLGGWIDTEDHAPFFFEKGPRVFRKGRSSHLLTLLSEIGLTSDIIEASSKGRARHLWIDGRLYQLPILSWELIRGIYQDWKTPPLGQDESVWDFALRRFNETTAYHFFDPLVTGIYGGDMKTISMQGCFPHYKSWEEKYGSLFKGFWKNRSSQDEIMFGMRRGMASVIKRLAEKTAIPMHLEEEVTVISVRGKQFEITTSQGRHSADYIFSALPAPVMGKLFIPELKTLPMQGATIVQLGYRGAVCQKRGFGYLVSSKEASSEVMGVIFDSNVFPEQSSSSEETRLTVKLKNPFLEDEKACEAALFDLAKHLGITAKPDMRAIIHAPDVFPQFQVGHVAWMQKLIQTVAHHYPHLYIAGNYLEGVSVDACIARARKVVTEFLNCYSSRR